MRERRPDLRTGCEMEISARSGEKRTSVRERERGEEARLGIAERNRHG